MELQKSGSARRNGLWTASITFTRKNASSLRGSSFSRFPTMFLLSQYCATCFKLLTAREIRRTSAGAGKVKPDARRADVNRRVHPFLAALDSRRANLFVGAVETMMRAARDVHHRHANLGERLLEAREISRIGGFEVLVKRLNVMELVA